MRKFTPNDIIPGVKSAVNAYLLARAYAETMRDAVDKIQRRILLEAPLSNGLEQEHGMPAQEITDPKDTYLETREDYIQDYYRACDIEERKAGLKPDDMPTTHCPALVAEELQRVAERLIISNAAEMLNLEFDGEELNHRLICLGLEKHQEFIDLVVKMVVNHPDFKSPLAKAA